MTFRETPSARSAATGLWNPPTMKFLLGLLGVLLLTVQPIPAADDYYIPPAKKNHWAWKPPARPAPPVVRDQTWPHNPIDAFILARIEAAGLRPASPASREQLLRRVTL